MGPTLSIQEMRKIRMLQGNEGNSWYSEKYSFISLKKKCDINAGEISKMYSWNLEDKLLQGKP